MDIDLDELQERLGGWPGCQKFTEEQMCARLECSSEGLNEYYREHYDEHSLSEIVAGYIDKSPPVLLVVRYDREVVASVRVFTLKDDDAKRAFAKQVADRRSAEILQLEGIYADDMDLAKIRDRFYSELESIRDLIAHGKTDQAGKTIQETNSLLAHVETIFRTKGKVPTFVGQTIRKLSQVQENLRDPAVAAKLIGQIISIWDE